MGHVLAALREGDGGMLWDEHLQRNAIQRTQVDSHCMAGLPRCPSAYSHANPMPLLKSSLSEWIGSPRGKRFRAFGVHFELCSGQKSQLK